MHWLLFGAAWTFVFLVAAFDTYFAWTYRETFHTWELNPLARWAAAQFGLQALFAFKFAALTFALALSWYCRHYYRPLGWTLTAVVTVISGGLLAYYLAGGAQPELASYAVAMLEYLPAVR